LALYTGLMGKPPAMRYPPLIQDVAVATPSSSIEKLYVSMGTFQRRLLICFLAFETSTSCLRSYFFTVFVKSPSFYFKFMK